MNPSDPDNNVIPNIYLLNFVKNPTMVINIHVIIGPNNAMDNKNRKIIDLFIFDIIYYD